ncbi:type I-B CRISPR-associated protein Cas5b [Geofilum rubicundum]|uniref:CRISPR-associated protein, Cas5t family n=1 Tax=Geofilum rubicundum JCM 15548 TaxID=1236989 RepID=A0A0E9LUT2_9BACT|nr:type I-B CRISPR-associated protein Cas5b [Geofilum rubicundum]GAO28625.1 CRISPR-associated protein, Cas5t family [Geofilum rubicundum JCM 15548]
MKAFRLKLNSWTSSFRYPNLISGFQPTLEVPPVSTVMGLINAASGKYLQNRKMEFGYYFDFKIKTIDLETIYQIKANGKNYPDNAVKSNVMHREFLYDCRLFLYLVDEDLVSCFREPAYQLLLGRSGDLAGIESIKVVEMQEVQDARFGGQVIPFHGNNLPGQIQALPKYFSNTIPRKNMGTEPYSVISYNNPVNSQLHGYRSVLEEFDSDIFFHKFEV